MKYALFIPSLFFTIALYAQRPAATGLTYLRATKGAKISSHKSTDVPAFIRFAQETPLNIAGDSLPEKAAAFFKTYGDAYGIKRPESELFLQKTVVDAAGGTHLAYGQLYQGVPVFGSDLRLHFNARHELTAVNGVVVPDIGTGILSNITPEQAGWIALEKVAALQPEASATWFVQRNTLYIFRKGLVRGFPDTNHLAYEVEVSNDDHFREFVYVDAVSGAILEQFPGACNALYRRLYLNNAGNQIWQEGNAFPGSLTSWQQSELNGATGAYNFFKNAFGRVSFNGADAEMHIVHAATGLSCPNGMWDGFRVNICDQVGTDDVMGHEFGHGYTEFTNNLIYAWQPGALNESYSDIWGETIDLLSPDGNDVQMRSGCANTQLRWQFAEAAPGFGNPIRDLWSPNCDGLPGKVTDTQYACTSLVHVNSSVSNHAYALLTDGGTYNGQTITGIGLTKAAHIFWQAQTAYLTNTSDFYVMADALESGCADLIGIDLEGLSVSGTPFGPSGEIITAGDCQQVANVNAAVEFRTSPTTQPEPGCNFPPLLGQSPPALCGGGTTPANIFYENFETGLGNWTITQIPTNPGQWTPHGWEVDDTPPDGRPGSVVFGPTPDPSNCNTGDGVGIIRMESPVISIPGDATAPIKMSFDHQLSMEPGYDGGNLKYRLNSGAWTLLPASAFIYNAYIYGSFIVMGSDNPFAGQPGFSAADPGSVSGTWGQSQINLASIGVVPGSNIQFRFEIGTNSCLGWEGWYIDDIKVFSCNLALPVNLLSFQAKPLADSIRLDWATASEFQNLGFELQRSTGPSTGFEKIAFIQGKGASSSVQKYRYTDKAVQPGQTYYYRLRQLDFDGSEHFSPIAAATLPSVARLSLQPNPASNFVEISISGHSLPDMNMLVLDLQGKVVFSAPVENGYRLDLSELPPGIYIVKVTAGRICFVRKLVKN